MEGHRFTGGCLCGKVRLAIDAEPSRVGICHCLDCRKQYGAVFYTFAVFPDTAVAVTGETAHFGFRHFCPVCGSSVFDKRGSEIEVNAGAFDQDNVVRPTYETWARRREQWLPAFPVEHRYEHDREEPGNGVAPAPAPAVRASAPTFEVRDIHKRFGALEVLKGISLQARDGDVISIIGASGSGKSTLLRCVTMLEVPDAGEIRVAGEVIRLGDGTRPDRHQVDRMRTRLGMVFQSFNLWSHMTVLDNVMEAPVHVQKRPAEECRQEALALLEKVGIADKRDQYPVHLSGGQQQRAAIARALAMRPQVLLFDEPTSALDPELVGEVLRVMRQLAEEGRTMLIVTHELRFAREVSKRTVFLHEGRVEEEGPPAEVLVNPRSERCRQFIASHY